MSKLRLRKALKNVLDLKADTRRSISGLLGTTINGKNRVKVPNRNGFVYVRLQGNSSRVIEAFNESVNTIYGLPVQLAKEDGIYKITGRDILRYQSWGGNKNSANLAPHGAQHSFGYEYGSGDDVVWVYKRQFMPLLLRPHTGTVVAAEDDWYLWNENFYHFTGSYINLVNSVPGAVGDARFVTVYLNGNTNTLNGVTGAIFPDDPFPTNLDSYIPNVHYSAGIPLGSILLTHATTNINWEAIYDLRPIFVGKTGGGLSSFLVYDNSIFKATGTAIDFENNLQVFVTGSVVFVRARTPEITVYEDGIYKVTGVAIDFTDGLDVSTSGTRATIKSHLTVRKNSGSNVGSQSKINLIEGAGIAITTANDATDKEIDITVSFTGTTGGGGSALTISQQGSIKSTGTSQIDFGAGFNVAGSGTSSFINISLTGTSTYVRAGAPIALTGITGAYWKIPESMYASGSLSLFVQGLAQQPGTDFVEQYPSSGTYRYLFTPPTGAVHTVIWGNTAPSAIGTIVPYNPVIAFYTRDVAGSLQVIPHNTGTVLNPTTKVYDTHSFVAPGLAWKFQPNIEGYYSVAAGIQFSNTTAWAAGSERALMRARKNGSVICTMTRDESYGSAASNVFIGGGGVPVYLNGSTDYLDVFVDQNSGVNLTGTAQWISVSLIR